MFIGFSLIDIMIIYLFGGLAFISIVIFFSKPRIQNDRLDQRSVSRNRAEFFKNQKKR